MSLIISPSTPLAIPRWLRSVRFSFYLSIPPSPSSSLAQEGTRPSRFINLNQDYLGPYLSIYLSMFFSLSASLSLSLTVYLSLSSCPSPPPLSICVGDWTRRPPRGPRPQGFTYTLSQTHTHTYTSFARTHTQDNSHSLPFQAKPTPLSLP